MTKQEKLAIYFLIGLMVLGLCVKFYNAKIRRVEIKIEEVNLRRGGPCGRPDIININTANADDFARLPGIGNALAQRIIEYRNQNSSFFAKEDLRKVKGIGRKKYENIKDYLLVE